MIIMLVIVIMFLHKVSFLMQRYRCIWSKQIRGHSHTKPSSLLDKEHHSSAGALRRVTRSSQS